MIAPTYPPFDVISLLVVPVILVLGSLGLTLVDAVYDYISEKNNPSGDRHERTRTK